MRARRCCFCSTDSEGTPTRGTMCRSGSVATIAYWPSTSGDAAKPTGRRAADYSTDAFVADLEEFCYTLGLEKFVLVGHSMGGRNSMAFAGRNPDMLEKLVIVDIGPDIDPVGSARITRELVDIPEEFDELRGRPSST